MIKPYCSKLCLSLAGALLGCSLTHADLSEDLTQFFHEQGFAANISGPGAYQDQSAGYYTGGQMMARNRVHHLQPMTIQLPGIKAGCGGIDAWAGGFSHINSQQLVDFIKNVGQNCIGYATHLAIATISPMISNQLKDLNDLATRINTTNITSCEVASTLVSGAWPKGDQASQLACKGIGTKLGEFSDWASAKHGCAQPEIQAAVAKDMAQDPRYKDILLGEYNLVWKALGQHELFKKDRDLATWVMNFTGTLIRRTKEKDVFETLWMRGKGDQAHWIQPLLQGSAQGIALLKCEQDTDKAQDRCLYLEPTTLNLPISKSIQHQVQTRIDSLLKKLRDDQGKLEPQDLEFLEATPLPLYKILNVISAYRGSSGDILDLKPCAQLVAFDLFKRYLDKIVTLVHSSLTRLKQQQFDETDLNNFLASLSEIRSQLYQSQVYHYQRVDSQLKLIEQTRLLEQNLFHKTALTQHGAH